MYAEELEQNIEIDHVKKIYAEIIDSNLSTLDTD